MASAVVEKNTIKHKTIKFYPGTIFSTQFYSIQLFSTPEPIHYNSFVFSWLETFGVQTTTPKTGLTLTSLIRYVILTKMETSCFRARWFNFPWVREIASGNTSRVHCCWWRSRDCCNALKSQLSMGKNYQVWKTHTKASRMTRSIMTSCWRAAFRSRESNNMNNYYYYILHCGAVYCIL